MKREDKPEEVDSAKESTTKPVAPGVGYGRPPVTTQFRKGQSGNPNGRPKGTKNLKTLIQEALDEKIIVNEYGERKAITKKHAGAKQLANKVAAGDTRTMLRLLDLQDRIEERKKAKNAADENSLESSLPADSTERERLVELTERYRERIARRKKEEADGSDRSW